MPAFVALLRGINVGGNRQLPMADLRALCTMAGCERVTTYIQSGNVVFTHPTLAPDALEAALELAIEEATGWAVPVLVRTATELAGIVRDNPFPGVEPTKLLVGFLRAAPTSDQLTAFDPDGYAPERYVVVGREVYLHLPDGAGRSRLLPALPLLRPPATARNWRTVLKLLELTAA